MKVRDVMRARAKARYERAITDLMPNPDKSYDVEAVTAAMARLVTVDVGVMQMRQAKQDLELLRQDDEDEDGAQFWLNLFGEGRLSDYDPYRLVLGPGDRVIEHRLAPLEYKQAELERATLNRRRAQDKEARKEREVEIFALWQREQLAADRALGDLTWGNCVRETGILRDRPEAA